MKKVLLGVALLFLLAQPVRAIDVTAPTAPDSVSDLEIYEGESFSEGLSKILRAAFSELLPQVTMALRLCLCAASAALLGGLLSGVAKEGLPPLGWAVTLATAGILLPGVAEIIALARDTVQQMSEYGRLLLPVMAMALAAQGGVNSSAALYAATACVDALLSAFISGVLLPGIYLYLALSVACAAFGQERLGALRDGIRDGLTWLLKTALTLYFAYMSITGVVTGSTDALAVKATRMTISGMVPVVGGILSDASEAVVLTAGMVKNAAGVYGMLVLLALWLTPFLRIGVQYLLLKLTASLCAYFGEPAAVGLMRDFSGAMGLALGMTGTVCLMLLISTVCFMRAVS
ncbi:MAG: stage III sporulation protein AE [Firmicutes bacterium]|nr:stage III sporulation protein AE [Bacillota bacterium]